MAGRMLQIEHCWQCGKISVGEEYCTVKKLSLPRQNIGTPIPDWCPLPPADAPEPKEGE
jgi:hypothetical protein